jgi:serine/threonine protein kinase
VNEGPDLDSLAAAVADGEPVDWEAVEAQHPDPATRSIVRNLRRLSSIALGHRDGITSGGGPRYEADSWGHLRILDHVGSGAFGDVYRAWDPQLEREVALKLVPVGAASSARDSGLAEARLLARIRHPHVVTVHGAALIGRVAGLWMEFIEGRTLRHIVEAEGSFGTHETVITGVVLCRALGAVHRAGLLHGDIKAQNVMRERGGRIVLMDLGAGRLLSRRGEIEARVAGTPLYVAPEILAGRRPDVRSDLYSLGVVLFFLLTGQFPHRGNDAADILASQARGDSNTLRQLRNDLPDTLVSIVERCLATRPEARFENAAAVERALASCLGAQLSRDRTPRGWRPSRVMMTAAALVLLAGAAGWSLKSQRDGASDPTTPVRSVMDLSPELSSQFASLALSPRGTWVAYRASDHWLYVRRSDDMVAIKIPRSEGGIQPFFSPDERAIGFFAGETLKTFSLADGTVAALTTVSNPRGATWTSDGHIVYSPTAYSGLWQIPASGGTAQPLTTLRAGEASHRWPAALPGGAIVATVWPSHDDVREASIVRFGPAQERLQLVAKGTYPQYASAGVLTYADDGEVFAMRYDPERPERVRRGVSLQAKVLTDELTGFVHYGVSDLALLYVAGGTTTEPRRLVWVDRTGAAEYAQIPPRNIERPRIAPDGRQLVFVVRERRTDLYHFDLARGVLTRLTLGTAAEHESPVWSPDSVNLAYSTWTHGTLRSIVRRPAEGTGQPRAIATTATHDHVSGWSPEHGLVITSFNEQGRGDIALMSAGTPGTRTTFLATPSNERDGQLSPDGNWMVYTSDESGHDEVYVRHRTGARRVQVSSDGGSEPTWRGDGRAIFYRSRSALMQAMWDSAGNSNEPRPLFVDQYARTGRREINYAVMPDGSRFLMVESNPRPARPLRMLVHWTGTLEPRLAPVRQD